MGAGRRGCLDLRPPTVPCLALAPCVGPDTRLVFDLLQAHAGQVAVALALVLQPHPQLRVARLLLTLGLGEQPGLDLAEALRIQMLEVLPPGLEFLAVQVHGRAAGAVFDIGLALFGLAHLLDAAHLGLEPASQGGRTPLAVRLRIQPGQGAGERPVFGPVAGGRALTPGDSPPLYLVIEKILAEHEQLPSDWPIHGATGYRFANLANNLFVDTAAERRMTRIYADFIGASAERGEFESLVHQTKQVIMDTALSSELNVLANRLARIAALDRRTCDFTLHSLRDALAEVVACFPVYRTYVSESGLSADDRRHIDWAIGIAKKHSPTADLGIYGFIQGVLTTDIAQGRPDPYRMAVTAFAMKFQQFSSPVMAKGVEDTVFYRYHRLSSLNDVGGEPRRFGISVAAYHAATRERMKRWPHNLLATSTHDSKRSEDVRCRIDVLSEIPAAWKLMLRHWSRLNQSKKRQVDGGDAPSANDEYLIYQTLIGTWPLETEVDLDAYRGRIVAYLTKAVREAKEHSNWINVNGDYEAAVADFIGALLTPGEKNLFLADFIPFAQRIARHGLLNSMALTLLKLTAPGVPDIYQGCEMWQFKLVDPDNRQPIDYDLRQRLLEQLDSFDTASPLADPCHKLALIQRTLALRTEWPELFRDGGYLPIIAKGKHANHVCAYARRLGDQAVIVVVPRLIFKLLGGTGDHIILPLGDSIWGDTVIELPKTLRGHDWRNMLTGKMIDASAGLTLGRVLKDFPLALLASDKQVGAGGTANLAR